MIPLSAVDLVQKVRRRAEIRDGTAFSDEEILRLAEAAMERLFNEMRRADQDYEAQELTLSLANFTAVSGRQQTVETVLPERVADVIKVEGLEVSGRRTVRFTRVPVQVAGGASGPAWSFISGRVGTLRIQGSLNRWPSIVIWYTRRWGPLHYGTVSSATATTLVFPVAPTGGLVLRDAVYEGMDVVITNDSPAGVKDQMRRVSAHVGTTRTASVATWGQTPTGASTYSMVVPIPPEHGNLLIEETAQIIRSELGEMSVSPQLELLRRDFASAMAERSRDLPKVIWNTGA
jgi:hypothetical protein